MAGMLQPRGRTDPWAVNAVRHPPSSPCGSWEERGLLSDFKNKHQGQSSPSRDVVGDTQCLQVTEAPRAPTGGPCSILGTHYS